MRIISTLLGTIAIVPVNQFCMAVQQEISNNCLLLSVEIQTGERNLTGSENTDKKKAVEQVLCFFKQENRVN